jgi:translation initiation factor 2 alpha subunit (eIF-2alpha)
MDGKKEKQEREAIDAVTSRLKKKFPDLPKSSIEQIVEDQYKQMSSARLRDYIPVLVEHAAKQTLRAKGKGKS